MLIEVLKSKIHRVTVTDANLNYIGSITIDRSLMEAANLIENDLVHRQNDALLYGFGMSAKLYNVSLAADYSGFYGYKNNGDYPVTLRTKFEYEIKKNIISIRFKHGMYDNLYDSYSLAYIRCF